MSITTMDRRQAVRLLAALCGSALAAQFPVETSGASCPAWIDAELASALKSLETHDLGSTGDDVANVWSLMEKGDEAALQRLAAADYESGRVLNVGGWWVSATEGRMFVAIRAHC
jgi:hypothetical protein